MPIGVQKSYFMLTETERNLLNFALEKYRPGQTEPILVGGQKILKPALRLAANYRLVIEEIKGSQAYHELYPMGGCRAGARNGKSGNLSDIQSAL